MVASALQVAKRALLATMRTAAVLFGLRMTCNRDSADSEMVSYFRELALRAHPDRPGGSTVQQQRLNDARASWEQARFLAACFLEGDMMSAIPLRRYESSCHSTSSCFRVQFECEAVISTLSEEMHQSACEVRCVAPVKTH